MAKKKAQQIPTKDRIKWVNEPTTEVISLNRKLALVGLGKSSFYYVPVPESAFNLLLMNEIDEIFAHHPYYGARRMWAELTRKGYQINIKRVSRLYDLLGIHAIYPKPNLSRPNKENTKYPYLLKSITINRPNHVWSVDITYVPMEKGFLYKVAFIDWYSRYILSYRISNTLDTDFVLDALRDAIQRYGAPQIINSDQGCQFTSKSYIEAVQLADAKISMDGKGRAIDNVRIERYWRSFKYECVFLYRIENGMHLNELTANYVKFYNTRRPHQAMGYITPNECYFKGLQTPLKRIIPVKSLKAQNLKLHYA